MPVCRRRVAILVVALCLPLRGSAAAAPDPVGPEFRVDTAGGTPQGNPSVGVSAAGDFLVLWQATTPDGKRDGL